VTICQLPHRCPSTSSRCWLTWRLPDSCKLVNEIHPTFYNIQSSIFYSFCFVQFQLHWSHFYEQTIQTITSLMIWDYLF
jgi:hypothetical protein